jgi:hypothetical protein
MQITVNGRPIAVKCSRGKRVGKNNPQKRYGPGVLCPSAYHALVSAGDRQLRRCSSTTGTNRASVQSADDACAPGPYDGKQPGRGGRNAWEYYSATDRAAHARWPGPESTRHRPPRKTPRGYREGASETPASVSPLGKGTEKDCDPVGE